MSSPRRAARRFVPLLVIAAILGLLALPGITRAGSIDHIKHCAGLLFSDWPTYERECGDGELPLVPGASTLAPPQPGQTNAPYDPCVSTGGGGSAGNPGNPCQQGYLAPFVLDFMESAGDVFEG
jgi:hypothetical protein